jgi:glutamate 5-kinase
MADNKSKPKKAKDTSRNEAIEKSTQKASNVATSKQGNNMSDNGMPSVVEFSEDISQSEAPTPLPAGDYPAEIRAAVQKLGASSGKPYGSVQFFIAPEAYPADFTEGEPDGTILSYNMVSLQDTPAARFRLRRFLEAIGAPAGAKVDLNDWVGRTATVSIQRGEFEGVPKAEIAKVTAA